MAPLCKFYQQGNCRNGGESRHNLQSSKPRLVYEHSTRVGDNALEHQANLILSLLSKLQIRAPWGEPEPLRRALQQPI